MSFPFEVPIAPGLITAKTMANAVLTTSATPNSAEVDASPHRTHHAFTKKKKNPKENGLTREI